VILVRIILLLIIVLSVLHPITITQAKDANLKIAFIRDGDVWVLRNEKEQQITDKGKIFAKPKWSQDGKWLLYQMEAPSEFEEKEPQVEIWAYNTETEEKKKIFYDASSPIWAPNRNEIAFNAHGILNISDLKQFYNIATGVNSFTWLPDGSGFLLSSAGALKPDGWSSAEIFTKKVKAPYQDIVLFGGVEHFFTLPREIGTNEKDQIIAVYANDFTYSPSNKWISFIVSPTASWSMDSNMLCVINKEGNHFEILDEVILHVGKPKWAPANDTLAYIAGGGRIVFGFKNKALKVREMPASGSFTPPRYADIDFDWVTDNSIVTSRVEEREWSNDFQEHPLPSLYSIKVNTNKQERISNPPEGYGDYNPQYIEPIKKLVWLRGTSITDQNRVLWKANADGTGAEEWINNVDAIEIYSES
jgi:hypothetical protein